VASVLVSVVTLVLVSVVLLVVVPTEE